MSMTHQHYEVWYPLPDNARYVTDFEDAKLLWEAGLLYMWNGHPEHNQLYPTTGSHFSRNDILEITASAAAPGESVWSQACVIIE